MAKFHYTATDSSGKKRSGKEVGASAGAVHLGLVEQGFVDVEVSETQRWTQLELTKKKLPRKDVMHFSRQMGVFIKAGIPIMEALDIIVSETSNKGMKKVLRDVKSSLQAGDTFAAAASRHPEAFPNYYVGILRSAEHTGTLDIALAQLSDYMERDADARGILSSALIYPAVVACMSVVTVIVLALFVMPRFIVFFKSFNAKLPLPTRMLLNATAFFSKWWTTGGAIILVIVVVIWFMRRNSRGRLALDGLLLQMPVIGNLIETAVLERICRVLASLIGSGVALPEAMSVTAQSANNSIYARALNVVREQVMQGQGLAAPLALSGLFPGAALQMFRVGEETGTLDQQLDTAATFYGRELQVKVKRVTSLFEPIIIIFMGCIVGFVAIALISAMYGIYRQVKVG
jgi:type IV pilus assembly protein PilC